MAALFLLALALIVWQGVRTKPLNPDPLSMAWNGGEQVFPITAPYWIDPIHLPEGRLERYQLLRDQSVPWPNIATTAEGAACESFIRASTTTWVRRGVDPRLLPGATGDRDTLSYAANDFLDDDDGDGDALDAGELISGGSGAEVEVFCPPPAGAEAQP